MHSNYWSHSQPSPPALVQRLKLKTLGGAVPEASISFLGHDFPCAANGDVYQESLWDLQDSWAGTGTADVAVWSTNNL